MKIKNLIGFAIACAAGSMLILTLQIIRLDNNASTQRVMQGSGGTERQATLSDGDDDARMDTDGLLVHFPPLDASRRAIVPPSITATTPVQQAVDAIVQANAALLSGSPVRPSTVTLVSGLWDLGRGSMATSPQWEALKRPFSHYINGLKQFLAYKIPKVLYVEPSLYAEVKQLVEEAVSNGAGPTKVVSARMADVRADFGRADDVERIRKSREWLLQGGAAVANSPQALLSDFNPLVVSKLRLARDAARWNPFGTDGFLWLDGTTSRLLCL